MLVILVFVLFWAALQPVKAVPAFSRPSASAQALFLPLAARGLQQPTLRWKLGGCYASWCETGWYSSPAVADVNGDGKNEVIASAYSLFALNGDTGALIWRAGGTANRTWPGVIVTDIDKNGTPEIVIAQSGGKVSAYSLEGVLKWQNSALTGAEFRGVLAADLDANGGPLEIVVTRASGSAVNTWVLDAAGNALGGKWPQMNDNSGYAWGVYNANLAAGDLRPDLPGLELVVPSDVHYIAAYDKSGNSLATNAALYAGKAWGKVGVWESPTSETKSGGGDCAGVRAESYRANFADGPAVIADLNHDGTREVVAVGNMYDCSTGYPPSRYAAPFIFNADRSRFNSGGFDWSSPPLDTGAPLSEDYNTIESYQANPVIADLDGDGNMEMLFSSYDGRVHAFWLDKAEHGSWPFSLITPGDGVIRFASEPLVADLDNDSRAEVIFTSWTQKGSGLSGKLHILSAAGQRIWEVDLPAGLGSDWNGGLAAPTLAKIGTSPDYAVIVNTAHSGVVVYDLPGTANARILWGSGRGGYTRQAAR
jgi:hypothetical protein